MINNKLQCCKNRIAALLCLVAVLCYSQNAFSQSRIIKGVVTDAATKETIPGVNIKIKNSNRATVTDGNGAFSIQAQSTDVLVVSYVGFLGKEVRIGDQTTISVSLNEDVRALDQVVVIGYGEVAQRDLTGSVGVVNVEEMAIAPVMSLEESLAGRIAGVQVSIGDGQPGGSGADIVIRGAGSITQDVSPLWVVDGFIIEDFDPASLNMDDIESMNVLKDASATAIYGARGANGVIVLETKKGKIGAPVVSYNASFGFQRVTKQMEMMSPYEFVKYQVERASAAVRTYTPGDLAPGAAGFNILGNTQESYRNIKGLNWQDLIFQDGLTQTHNISLRGGTKETKYSLSGSIFDQKGVIIHSAAKRVTGRLTLDQAITNKIKTRINLSYSNAPSVGQVAASNASIGGHAYGYLMYSTWGFRPITGRETLIDEIDDEFLEDEFDEEAGVGTASVLNPVISLKNEDRQSKKSAWNGNINVRYDITKNLYFDQSFGYNRNQTDGYNFYNTGTARGTPLNSSNVRGVTAALSFGTRDTWKSTSLLTYRKKFNRVHNTNFMLGYEIQENIFKTYGFGSQLIPNESLGLSGMDEGLPISQRVTFSNNRMESVFARATYDYKSKYLFTVTARRDGSSKFVPENQYSFFPSAAFAWRISDENFMKNISVISNAKLRASYGGTGNNRVTDFAPYSTMGANIGDSYSFNNGIPTKGMYPSILGNRNLLWETTYMSDLGLDIGFLKDRIDLTVDLYRKNTTDLLLNANIPESMGFPRAYKNIGEVQNEGLELTLNTINIKNKNFQWSSNFNISFNRNKIIALTDDEPRMYTPATWDSQHNPSMLWVAEVNNPVALFMGYVFDGVYQYDDFDFASGVYTLKKGIPDNGNSTVNPGDIKYKDLNADGTVDGYDQTIIGNPTPKHIGGFSNNFKYKGFGLNVFFQWSYGNDVFNANRIYFEGGRPQSARNQFATYADRWTPENPSNEHFRNGGQGPLGRYSSKVVEDASYLRLKTIQFSYNLPAKLLRRVKLKNVGFNVTAQNLYTWTNYSGMDPEVLTQRSFGALTPGFDWSAYPRAKTIVVGIKALL